MTEIAGTGAHLDATQLRAWTSFVDASRILETELESQLVEQYGMTHREYEVLVRVDGSGGRLRMSVLARQIEASAALISQTVSRLEGRGWIERSPTSGDGRGVDAVLTPEGRKALSRAAKPHAALVERLLLDHFGEHLDDVAIALGEAADHFRQHRAGDPCDDPTCPMNTASR